MARAVVCVLDSLGIGAAEDAHRFGDMGADTLGHIAEACASGQGDRDGLRHGPLHLPHLARLGLQSAAEASRGAPLPHLGHEGTPQGQWGYGVETSLGKDTPSGHWEMMGLPVDFAWGYFPDTQPCFPEALTQALITEGHLSGILGNRHASGTAIIAELGAEHMRTGKPICYTSADSVFQIAAHEESFGLARLYDLCELAFRLVKPYRIARVIARPFLGTPETGFTRTGNRRDYTVSPHGPTLLDVAKANGREVIGIGKIFDIFAGAGITDHRKAHGNDALFTETLSAVDTAPDGSLILTNFVDFDQLYGHRRDVAGYAAALEAFDRRLPELLARLGPDDLLLITADHGCDPTFRGTDHTREHVPILAFGPDLAPRNIGRRESFSDMGASLAQWLALPPLRHGMSWL